MNDLSYRRVAFVQGEGARQELCITPNGGRSFDIRHPEMSHLGRSTMTIFMHLDNETGGAHERQVEGLLQMTESVVPLDIAARPQGA
ncbi:MAG: hypothetical protein U0840_30405 [Gemmataceae bacterium]